MTDGETGIGTTPEGVLSINQVVAYNLMRSRRQKAWTQDQMAEKLTEATGRKWTNATLSAAERSWQTGRTREFNANELVAFARVFGQPVAYFLVPVEGAERQYAVGPVGQRDDGREPRYLTAREVLGVVLPDAERSAKPPASVRRIRQLLVRALADVEMLAVEAST